MQPFSAHTGAAAVKILPDNRLIALGTIAGALIALTTAAWHGAAWIFAMRAEVAASSKSDVDQEGRIRGLESGIGEIHGDLKEVRANVSWIRSFLDPHPAPRAKPDMVAQP